MPTERHFLPYALGRVLGHRVYAATTWGVWALQSLVHCTSLTWTCSPGTGTAQLYYRYGYGNQPGATAPQIINPYTLPALAFVKIECDVVDYDELNGEEVDPEQIYVTKTWYGVVGSIIDELDGHQVLPAGGSTTVPSGSQTLPAVGLEWLLERFPIEETWFMFAGGAPQSVQVPPTFNHRNLANRTTTESEVHSNSTHVFLSHLDWFCDFWTATDIVKYLVGTFKPFPEMVWKLEDPLNLIGQSDDRPVIPTRNTTRRQLLDRLMPRHRGLTWKVHVDPDSEHVQVRPATFVTADLVNDTTTILRADPERQFTLENWADRSGGIQITTDALAKYDRIHVRGARAVSCFTVKLDEGIDGGAAINWDSQQQDKYQQGGRTLAGYPPAGNIGDRQLWHAQFRSSPEVADVYSRWRFTTTFAQTARVDGTAVLVKPDGTEINQVLYSDLRVCDYLPLQVGGDYSGNTTVTVDKAPVYRRPFAAFLVPGTADRYIDVTHLRALNMVEGPGDQLNQWENPIDNFRWSASVVPDRREPGFELVITGQPRHVIDKNFPRLPEDPDLGKWDYQKAEVTLAVELPIWCEAFEPAPDGTYNYVRLIDAGPAYQLHYLAAKTRVAADRLYAQRRDAGAWIRDDRPRLTEIAKLAWAWYGTERRGLRFSTSLVTNGFDVGDMITSVIEPSRTFDVHSVVTEIKLMFPISPGSSRPEPPRIEYSTQFAELDFPALV